MRRNNNQTHRDLASSDGSNQPLCIQYSEEVEFELRSGIINLLPKFHGLAGEDPNRHLQEFHMVCSTMKPHGVLEEEVKLRAFPFSLADIARDWLYYLPPGSVTCWNDMRRMFLDKFFPASRTNAIRKSISGIKQVNGETLYEYWERFKRLCASCPQHQISDQLLIQYFYEGLLNMDRSLIDAASGGALVNKTPTEARELIETMAENYQQFGTNHIVERGVHEAQVISPDQGKTMSRLEDMLARMELATKQLVSYQHQHSTTESVQAMKICSICSSTLHLSDTCPTLQPEEASWFYEQSVAAANAFPNRLQFQQNQQGRYDPLSATYNPGWRDHPNLRYSNPMAAQQPNSQPYQSFYQKAPGFYQNSVPNRFHGGFQQSYQQPQNYQQNFQQPSRQFLLTSQPESANQDLKEILQQMVLGQQQTQATLQNLGQQLSQLASNSGHSNSGQLQTSGSSQLPSQVVPNPRGNVSAITLRSGKCIAGPGEEGLDKETEAVDPIRQLQFGTIPGEFLPSRKLSSPPVLAPSKEPTSNLSLPFPQRVVQSKKETSTEKTKEFQELMDIFSKVEVNIPLLKVIKNIPKYAKFLKDLCVHKRKLKGDELVSMGKNVSALFQSMPQKCQDLWVFTIQCEIGESSFGDAMLDLGASINVIPKSIFQALGIGPLQPTRIVIQLANRSFAHPVGVLEDVLVKVRDLIFPVDFYVLDMEGDTLSSQVPTILGRPFLKTARTKIDVHAGTLSMEFGDTRVQFNVLDAMKYPVENHSILSIEVFDELEMDSDIALLDCINFLKYQDRDEGDGLDFNLETDVDQGFILEASGDSFLETGPTTNSVLETVPKLFYSLEESSTPTLPSILKPPRLELKVLPDHLKYVYLKEKEQLPVIIANRLEFDQENKLIKVLRSYQRAIGWTVADIVGIDSSICMHRILLEDGARPVRQPQRRLNPLILDVVKKEVVKLLQAGIIYPISDSVWVSPVQVVPKKSGVTVVANKENELISTRVQNSWRVCIDYRRLNHVTRKDHFPLPFIDQMLERLAGKTHYCFLDGYSGYFQICIAPEDQEKTTFTCPFGTFTYRRMPFGLCNAPGTFQRCMVSIFYDLLEHCMEVFMDDFTVYGSSFDACLDSLSCVLRRCVEKNLVLNYEKCHFMIRHGIVLGHIISEKGIEVDPAKISAIIALSYPTCVREVRSFLGHAGFYRRFIRDFSTLALPLSRLLQKDVEFTFDVKCKDAFDKLREALTSPPIMCAPDWFLPFELMCDASNFAVGAVLAQRVDGKSHVISYASRTLDSAQSNYTTTEKELLAIVFALDKFRSYLLCSHVIIFSDHAALKFLLKKSDAKPRLIRLMLLLQEFDIEIRDRSGKENPVADHLSRIEGTFFWTSFQG